MAYVTHKPYVALSSHAMRTVVTPSIKGTRRVCPKNAPHTATRGRRTSAACRIAVAFPGSTNPSVMNDIRIDAAAAKEEIRIKNCRARIRSGDPAGAPRIFDRPRAHATAPRRAMKRGSSRRSVIQLHTVRSFVLGLNQRQHRHDQREPEGSGNDISLV